MAKTTTTIKRETVRADEVRVGDFVVTAGNYHAGRVIELPEWEDIDTWGDGSLIVRCGTLVCDGFGYFVDADDEITIIHT